MNISKWNKLLIYNRLKVDLTKYIEEHNFSFDNAFDYDADNLCIYD